MEDQKKEHEYLFGVINKAEFEKMLNRPRKPIVIPASQAMIDLFDGILKKEYDVKQNRHISIQKR